jgi:hypothetical protein
MALDASPDRDDHRHEAAARPPPSSKSYSLVTGAASGRILRKVGRSGPLASAITSRTSGDYRHPDTERHRPPGALAPRGFSDRYEWASHRGPRGVMKMTP